MMRQEIALSIRFIRRCTQLDGPLKDNNIKVFTLFH